MSVCATLQGVSSATAKQRGGRTHAKEKMSLGETTRICSVVSRRIGQDERRHTFGVKPLKKAVGPSFLSASEMTDMPPTFYSKF